MLYFFLKILVKIALKVFYKKITVQNSWYIPEKGPLIVVANHPNTFMDPLIIAAHLKTPAYFLANSGVFKTPLLHWLLTKLHMIPIQRKEDKKQEGIDNAQIFEKCYELLAKGGTLIIFPEGSSIGEKRIRQLKTGTARIAFGAVKDLHKPLNVRILTVGLNYTHPENFRSEVLLNVDEPIQVETFIPIYAKDNFGGIKQLTEAIRERLIKYTIVIEKNEHETLINAIELLYKQQLAEEILAEKKTTNLAKEFEASKIIIEALQYFQENDPERILHFTEKLQLYQQKLEALGLKEEVFLQGKKVKNLLFSTLGIFFYFVIGFPLYLYGLFNNYIPYSIPAKVAQKITKLTEVREYTAPVQMITGVFSFSLFYTLQITLFSWFIDDIFFITIYCISLPLSAFFALQYAHTLALVRNQWKFWSIFYTKNTLVQRIIFERESLLKMLEEAKNNYQQHYQQQHDNNS